MREHSSIEGRRILITGAGGSIGQELCRQVALADPAHMTLVELSEFNLYEIEADLLSGPYDVRPTPVLCDVRDLDAVRNVFLREQPEIVLHAAALKHVPLLENEFNLVEAVRTNVLGTKNVADQCTAYGVSMIMISTDKAVNPSSVMGLTKRVAEIYVHGKALRHPNVKIAQVRFGNVMGSSGSVIPKFKHQIAGGGPVTVTHPEMTRYLMSITQAVELVLSAADLHADKTGFGLYILDMGKPVKIVDLACQLIELAGFRPYDDIAINFTGVRPGEKLHEELSYAHELPHRSNVPGVGYCQPTFNPEPANAAIEQLLHEANRRDPALVKELLVKVVPEYTGAYVG